MEVFLILSILIMASIRYCDCINCYTCSSWNGTNINCHDPFNPAMSTYTEDCMMPKEGHIGQFPANFCIKIIGKTAEDNIELVIRMCTLENMDNQCGVFKFENNELKGCILTCDYDGCNGVSVMLASAALILTFLLLGSYTMV
ncbi:U-scoloptoxin(05)-Sm1a-like [Centruroides vittatus]|uniref:uncharacterized protein LOC111641588 n=1 Tax=Centruroides sculpturatus TaxID=218467 RepID=UPI000C6CDF99|nr:uncharacterized protein LOC111641588 [Centruroides sculpturatus]